MIIIERTITIKNDQATLDSPIYLYRGDGDIVCLFTIKEMKKAATFGKIEANNPVSQASYGNVRIYKPDGSKCVFTEKSEVIDDKLQVVFSYENIDQFTEVGIHKLQIHLYDDNDAHNEGNDKNRFTLPPIDINVLLPVGDDNNQVDEAIVDYSLLNAVDEDVPTFDEEGNYNKTIWETGDIITQDKLNKIEDALYQVTAADDDFITTEALEVALAGKADEGHTHNEYATTTQLANKANTNHSHTGYAPTNHYHSGYAASSHTHTGYATTNHNHTGYAASDHNHNSEYAAISHTHDSYLTQSALSNYATKSYVDNSGFLTTIPSDYITEGELENHLATKTYATIAYVNTAISNAGGFSGSGDGSIDLSDYATKIELDAKADIDHTHEGYLTTATLDSYALKSYVDDAVAGVQVDIDLSEYAKIEIVPTKVSDLVDYLDYATTDYVDDAVANVTVDLSGYATTEAMDTALVNKAEVDHTHEDYALKTEIPDMVTVPTNVSAFTNDAGYITDEAITPINEAIDNINESINDLDQNLNDYALKTDIPTKVVDLEDHEDYATNASVSEAINTINRNIEDNYATKGEIPTTTEQLTNDSGYITSNSVIRIEIVTELPETEEPGVLYIVKA